MCVYRGMYIDMGEGRDEGGGGGGLDLGSFVYEVL